jgi:hypothetical protein
MLTARLTANKAMMSAAYLATLMVTAATMIRMLLAAMAIARKATKRRKAILQVCSPRQVLAGWLLGP